MWWSRTKAIKAKAEKLLSNTFAYPIVLDLGYAIAGRSNIYRFKVIDGPQNLSPSIIVKQTRDIQNHTLAASGYPSQSWLFFNDWAGLQFMQQVFPDNALTPRFYAGSREQGIIISEELYPNKSLTSFLQGHDPRAAEQALLQFASSLGKMHAGTIGRQREFDLIRDTLALRVETWGWVPPWLRQELPFSSFFNALDSHSRESGFGSYVWMVSVFKHITSKLDISSTLYAEKEIETLITSMRNPGPFLALSHHDPCFDNCLLNGSTMKFVDFENTAYRHALIDGVYARMNFPTCAAVDHAIPDSIVQHMEAVYRMELIKGCPQAVDNTNFHYAIVEACAYWTLLLCQFDTMPNFAKHSTVMKPQRIVHRFERFAQTTQEFGYLEALGATFQAMATRLRIHWSLGQDTMEVYPVFKRKGVSH